MGATGSLISDPAPTATATNYLSIHLGAYRQVFAPTYDIFLH